MLKKPLLLLVMFCIALSILGAQEGDQVWYNGKVIKSIQFEGLKTISKSELAGITRPFIGQEFSDTLFRDLQSRLYALEYFEGLIVPKAVPGDKEKQTVIILFQVKEKPVVGKIDFSGNTKIRRTELMEQIVTKLDDMYRKSDIRLDEEAIKKLYISRGFAEVSVSSRVEKEEDENEVVLYFQIEEGVQTTIGDILFEGNGFASNSSLKKQMKTRVQGFFSTGPYREETLERDITRIEDYYWTKGYIDAKVINVDKQFVEDEEEGKQSLILVLTIQEGEQFFFDGITILGNKIFPLERLEKEIRLQKGEILDKTALEADFQRISDIYYENGYLFNEFKRSEKREGQQISYELAIIERPRAHIRDVIIKGNDKTRDDVIMREIPLETGEVFSKTKFITGYQNLMRLGYFNNITYETPISEDGLIDLIFNIEEGHTADIIFGIAFSGATDFPVSGNIKWQDRNFLGRGQTFGIEALFSPLSQTMSFNFTENWLTGRRWSGGISLSYQHNILTNVSQDVLSPIFNDEDIPDPFTGAYVFGSNWDDVTGDNPAGLSKSYSAGELFPYAIPSGDPDSWISTYNLVKDYDYFDESSEGRMEYDEHKFSLGLNTGYTWHTWIGRLSLSTAFSTGLTMIEYDASKYRPSDPDLRDNRGEWNWENKLTFGGSWDTRDLFYDPNTGFRIAERVTFAGGFLGGIKHYTRNEITAEAYHTLFDIPVTDTFDFKSVLKLKSTLTTLAAPLGGEELNVGDDQNYKLGVDGMFVGRGWLGVDERGVLRLDNKAEIRIPVTPGVLSLDFIMDGVALYGEGVKNPSGEYIGEFELSAMKNSDFYFSYGFGPRFAIPNFPLAFYFMKPFYYDSEQNEWETIEGDLFGGMSLVLTFGIDLF